LSSKGVAPDIAAVAPTTSSSETLVAGTTNWTTTVVGTNPAWETVRGRTMTEGRFIAGHDLATRADVVVLGSTTAQELFGRRDAVGQPVTINGVPMSVIGVLNTVGSSGSSSTTANQDDQAIVPLTTASIQLFGGTSRNSVSDILVQATSSSTLSAAYQEADTELLNLHGITNSSEADYTITPETSLVSAATSVDQTLTVLLGGIAAISLLVGGIGVMNIMLVSVTERIREIGLRKALGATPRVIRRQFLVEASVLGLLGGLLGVGLGLLGAWILPHFISDPIALSAAATVGAIVVAIGIGVSFGVYPAGRAAKLAPIDALRSE
jgi:putative ABC transport system permease protein